MAAVAAIAECKAGKRLSIVSLLVLMCEVVLHLRSKRINRGVTLQRQSSEHFGNADRTVADDNEEFIACVVVETNKRIVIQAKDKPFWEYFHAKGNIWSNLYRHLQRGIFVPQRGIYDQSEQTRSLNCKTYTEPQKPAAATLKNLTTIKLPEEMIDLIASFDDSALHCNACRVTHFQMEFFEKCSSPKDFEQFMKVHQEVNEEGGTCSSGLATLQPAGHTLQSCMGLNSYLPYGADGYMAAASFAGTRPGFAFKKGALGVGYYRDGPAPAAPEGEEEIDIDGDSDVEPQIEPEGEEEMDIDGDGDVEPQIEQLLVPLAVFDVSGIGQWDKGKRVFAACEV